jgi:hypothetical protein
MLGVEKCPELGPCILNNSVYYNDLVVRVILALTRVHV